MVMVASQVGADGAADRRGESWKLAAGPTATVNAARMSGRRPIPQHARPAQVVTQDPKLSHPKLADARGGRPLPHAVRVLLATAMSFLRTALDRGRELADRAADLAKEAHKVTTELGKGIAGGHKPILVEIEGRQLLLTALIAEGGYAYVHVARDTTSGEKFAVKRALAQDRDSAAIAQAELDLLRSLPRHPNIIEMFGALRRPNPSGGGHEFLYVLELCSKGSLAKFVTPRGPAKTMPPALKESRVLHYFVDTCKGVAHLHSQSPPIQHRDLKLENVLITERGGCKLCDFGSATSRVLDCAKVRGWPSARHETSRAARPAPPTPPRCHGLLSARRRRHAAPGVAQGATR